MTRFVTGDLSISVAIEPGALDNMLVLCDQAGGLETGGVLLGRYEFGVSVVVSGATGPPADSRRMPAAFVRGLAGLRRLLARAWKDGAYYVGEWHLHPGASARPSSTDTTQTLSFAEEPDYRCPHPVLVVIGGRPGRWHVSVGIALNGRFVRLNEVMHRPPVPSE
jgi:integrative and conjugative element protein (TIGR02256 family)